VLPDAPGAHFLAEIRGQPQAIEGLLEHEADYARVAAAARDRGATTVRMVGHGSSDNAASYGVYAFGLLPQWTAIRDSIALAVYYDTRLATAGSTVIGLSQSGRTPDVIEYVSRARKAGAFTVALTNDVTSDLAAEAEEVLPLSAGPEESVAATKTYLNQIAGLGLLAAHCAGEGRRFAEGLRVTAQLMEGMIPGLEARIRTVALPFASVGRMFVIGRGTEFATAREIALKLLETCRIAAEPQTRPRSRTGQSRRSIRCSRSGRSLPTTRRCPRSWTQQAGCGGPAPRSSRAATRPTRWRTPPSRYPCRSRRFRCSRRCSQWCRDSCSPARSLRLGASTRTTRRASAR
jgi:fructoselysine-6-P-deglycase FrlB-like protein